MGCIIVWSSKGSVSKKIPRSSKGGKGVIYFETGLVPILKMIVLKKEGVV